MKTNEIVEHFKRTSKVASVQYTVDAVNRYVANNMDTCSDEDYIANVVKILTRVYY